MRSRELDKRVQINQQYKIVFIFIYVKFQFDRSSFFLIYDITINLKRTSSHFNHIISKEINIKLFLISN